MSRGGSTATDPTASREYRCQSNVKGLELVLKISVCKLCRPFSGDRDRPAGTGFNDGPKGYCVLIQDTGVYGMVMLGMIEKKYNNIRKPVPT